ncbi:MAG: NUDIX hydrolase [Cellulosilyticaceae bacterium]
MKTKRIGREEVYKGKIFTVVEDTIEFSNGKVAKWDLVCHNGASAVVALTSDEKIVLVKQYRNAENGDVIEIPAGKLEKEEDPLLCANRELEEEVGLKAKKIEKICEMYTAVGFCDEKLHLYLATDLYKGKQNLDEDEFVEIIYHTVDEAVEMIFNGQIKDSKTIVGILAVQNLRKSN